MKILFILKLRDDYGSGAGGLSSGLFNSARFVVDMLNEQGFTAKLAQVVDNNSIDREVWLFRPDIVVIEGLWVVPEKFEVLRRLHPKVQWVVRIHSEIPFLAQEGVAMDWIPRYAVQPSVTVAANSPRGRSDLQNYLIAAEEIGPVITLPNYYPVPAIEWAPPRKHNAPLRVGCFGAIRPLKNQLIQALAAVEYARQHELSLHFYVTIERSQDGGQILKNIRSMFEHLPQERYQLFEASWMDHGAFLHMARQMDLGMCVSFSESFCIVAADFAANLVPLVTSDQVTWADTKADATDTKSIVNCIDRALNHVWGPIHAQRNLNNLLEYDARSWDAWRGHLLHLAS